MARDCPRGSKGRIFRYSTLLRLEGVPLFPLANIGHALSFVHTPSRETHEDKKEELFKALPCRVSIQVAGRVAFLLWGLPKLHMRWGAFCKTRYRICKLASRALVCWTSPHIAAALRCIPKSRGCWMNSVGFQSLGSTRTTPHSSVLRIRRSRVLPKRLWRKLPVVSTHGAQDAVPEKSLIR